MDYKKTNAPTTTVTRNMMELCEDKFLATMRSFRNRL